LVHFILFFRLYHLVIDYFVDSIIWLLIILLILFFGPFDSQE